MATTGKAADILGSSEAFRLNMYYFSYATDVGGSIERLAASNPVTLACMHGGAWRRDGAKIFRELGGRLCE